MDGLVEKLAAIVGKDNVAVDSGTLERYSKDGSFAVPLKPKAVVKAKSAEEVERIVQDRKSVV